MADLVTDTIADMQKKIATVTAIRNRVVYVYDEDDLVNAEKKLQTPCIGILYEGMVTNEKLTRREDAVIFTAQLVMLGGDYCELPNIPHKQASTKLMDDLRKAIRVAPTVATDLKWRFESEGPAEISRVGPRGEVVERYVGYSQVWTTAISIA